jgi:phosphoribosylglycinamide formyltransferase 1
MKHIAIFASGSGTNAREIINYFQENNSIAKVALVISNNKDAGVLSIAKAYNLKFFTTDRHQMTNTQELLSILKEHSIDLIVLAGFLLLIPPYLTQNYPNKIVNIHPALLPKFGGKGMYGKNVHLAVKNTGEKETGITIHFVNERYDEGKVLFQAKCKVLEEDSVEQIAHKVQLLEHQHYKRIIEQVISEII